MSPSTSDLIYLLDRMGVGHGVDLMRTSATAQWSARSSARPCPVAIAGRAVPGPGVTRVLTPPGPAAPLDWEGDAG
jgi:hypothetical protein